MKTTKKLQAILLAAVMTFGLFALVTPLTASAAAISASDAYTLGLYLGTWVADTGVDVVNVTSNITATEMISSQDVKTLNLNGNTVNANDGFYVCGGTLTVNGPGTLNISRTDRGALDVAGSFIVTGGAVVNVSQSNSAYYATYAVIVRADPDNGDPGYAMITGDIRAYGSARGVQARDGSTVHVRGSIKNPNNDEGFFGVIADSGAKVYISGTVDPGKLVLDDNWWRATFLFGHYLTPNTSSWTGIGFNVDEPVRKNVPVAGYEYNFDEFTDGSAYVYIRSGAGDAPTTPGTPGDTAAVAAFVTRLYRNVLDRTPDPAGIDAWVSRLASKEWGGGEAAESFFFGAPYYEFRNRGLNNEQFLHIMYSTFMDRDPDPTGWNAWLDRMNNQGYTWEQVFDGFVESPEWGNRCDAAGIRR